MTEDQRKKYEEAAKAYAESRVDKAWSYRDGLNEGFIAGCSFASQDTEDFIQTLKKIIENKDEQMALQHEIHKNAEKQVYNAALDLTIDLLGRRVGFGYLEENWSDIKEAIQKLKL